MYDINQDVDSRFIVQAKGIVQDLTAIIAEVDAIQSLIGRAPHSFRSGMESTCG